MVNKITKVLIHCMLRFVDLKYMIHWDRPTMQKEVLAPFTIRKWKTTVTASQHEQHPENVMKWNKFVSFKTCTTHWKSETIVSFTGRKRKANSHQARHREVDPVQEIPLLFKTTTDLLTMGWRLIAMEKWIPSVSILWHANTMTSIWLTVTQLHFKHIMKHGMVQNTHQLLARVWN